MKKLDNTILEKVSTAVEKYIKAYPLEYQNFKKQQNFKRSNLNNDWAEVNGYEGVVIRALVEYPETLSFLIKMVLDDAEFLIFKEDKYQIWFGNKFSDFRVTVDKL